MAQFLNMYKVELYNGTAPVVSLRQVYLGDAEANRIGAIVTLNGEPVTLTGTCSGTAILADGSTVALTGALDGNQAYVDLTSGCYSREGQIQVFVKLTVSGVTTTLIAAVGTVRITETDTVIDPGEIIPSVSALITAINDAVESIPADYSALLAAIAPAYADLSFPVTADTWCWYSGSLYRAKVDIPASETWTAAHWETAPLSNALAGDVAALKRAITRFANSKNLLLVAPLTENKYYYGSAYNSTSYSYFAVNVESGKTYKSATMIRFISRAGQGISNSDTYTYTATADEIIYFTLYNNTRSVWALCESTVDITTIGTYDAPTLNDVVLKQTTGNSKSGVMSQNAITESVGIANMNTDKASAKTDIFATMAVPSPNLYKPILNGYLLDYSNGNPVVSASYETSDYIPVKPGDVIHYQFDYGGTRRDSINYSGYSTIRRICAYRWDKSYISGGYADSVASYTVPQDVEYIRVSFAISTTFTNRALIKATTTDIVPYFEPQEVAFINPKYLVPQNEYRHFAGSYTDEIVFTDLTTSVKAMALNCVVNFSALPTFEIGIKNGTNTLLKITVTATTLTVYDYVFGGTSSATTDYTHGLTIADDVQIQAEIAETGKLSLTICSDGEAYTIPSEQSLTRAGLGYPYFKISSGSADYVAVSACAKDINKYIWLFGDSYLSNSSDRWGHYLNEKNYGTYMIDAYPGENSSNSLQSLKNLLKIGHPSYLVWCLGMNDGSDNSAPATAWKNAFDEVRYLCGIYDIKLIAATIPTVPTISHEYKNAYVKSLNVPYIDFAKAVGAQADGTWFTGMQYSDGVHPTAKGAKALYFEAITDFPQLAIQN